MRAAASLAQRFGVGLCTTVRFQLSGEFVASYILYTILCKICSELSSVKLWRTKAVQYDEKFPIL